MAVQLSVGDVVLVHSSEDMQIGVIRYIGYIHGYGMKQYAGIELIESIENGHDGIINGYKYFECRKGYGIYTKLKNIIRKLAASEIAIEMQQIIMCFKARMDEYVQAVAQRDEYIEKLNDQQTYLNQLLSGSTGSPTPNTPREISTYDASQSVHSESAIIDNQYNQLTPTCDDTKRVTFALAIHKYDNAILSGSPQSEIAYPVPSPPVTPITPIDSFKSETEILAEIRRIPVMCNNTKSTSVVLRNVDKKSVVFPFNEAMINSPINESKSKSDFDPTEILQSKPLKPRKGDETNKVKAMKHRSNSMGTEQESISDSNYDDDDDDDDDDEYEEEICDGYNGSYNTPPSHRSSKISKQSKHESPSQIPHSHRSINAVPLLSQSYCSTPLIVMASSPIPEPVSPQTVNFNHNKHNKKRQVKFTKPVPEIRSSSGSATVEMGQNQMVHHQQQVIWNSTENKNDAQQQQYHAVNNNNNNNNNGNHQYWIQQQQQQQQENKYYHNLYG